jgi:hypothetical protein
MNLPIRYHQQDNRRKCGAACAQMVLDSIGAGLLPQGPLYTDNHSNSAEMGWYTGPDGLEWTMNDRRPQGFATSFKLSALASKDALSRKIIWSIHHYSLAPIALVFDWRHWIVVRGYDTSADPSSSDDTSYAINGFYLNNPWPPTPVPGPPPPHNDLDGCGTGNLRGIANEHITDAAWRDTYMTGVKRGAWAGKFLALCDLDPPALVPGFLPSREAPFHGDGIIAPSQAQQAALRGLQEHRLSEQEGWNSAVSLVQQPDEPFLVQRLDRGDSYYYLVPMRSEEGPAILASVDARFGLYRQAAIFPAFDELLLNPGDRDRLLDRVEAHRPVLETLRRGGIMLRREALSVAPALVWRPCLESLSPYYPFYLITFGTQRLYLRVDGQLFTRLTLTGRGL